MIDPYRVPLTNRLTVPQMFMSCCIKSENVFCFVFLKQRFKFFHLVKSPARHVKGFCFHSFGPKKTFPVLMTYTRVGWGVLFNSSDSYNLCLSSVLSGFGTLWLLTSEPVAKLRLLTAASCEETDLFFSFSLSHIHGSQAMVGEVQLSKIAEIQLNCIKTVLV